MNEEVEQLVVDIRRIGGGEEVKFGALFDDDGVANYYEALVGTLKAAKKRGIIDFKGQMLLKGVHDDVVVSIKKTP
jgi:Costars